MDKRAESSDLVWSTRSRSLSLAVKSRLLRPALLPVCLVILGGLAVSAQTGETGQGGTVSTRWENGGWLRTQRGAIKSLHAQQVLRIEVSGMLALRPGRPGDTETRYTLETRSTYQDRERADKQLSAIEILTESSDDALSIGLSGAVRQLPASRLTITVPPRFKTIRVRQLGGSVDAYSLPAKLYTQIFAGEGRFVDVQNGLVVFSGGGKIVAHRIRGDVEISSGGGSAEIQDVRGAVRCELGGGDIYVRDVTGSVDVSTGGGNVIVERAASSVYANTQAGLLEVKNSSGPVVARNREGILRVFSSGNVKAFAPTGPIQVLGAYGYLSLSSGGGNIYVELSPKGLSENSRITTEGGSITILLPQRLKLTVEAESGCGCSKSVISEFPVTGGMDEYSPTVSTIPVNGGGTLLRAATQQGRIVVKKVH